MPKIAGIICALLVVAALSGGYLLLRHKPSSQSDVSASSRNSDRRPVRVHVFEDEAYLKKSDAIIGGTIQNVSDQPLANIVLTVKLASRDGKREETRKVALAQAELAPDAQATYNLAVPSEMWNSAKVVAVASANGSLEEEYRRLPGKPRPHEQPPAPIVRTVTLERRAPAKKGEEFINTPDTPVVIK